MTEMLATILAGLGLFFSGAKILGTNLKQMTSRKLRMFTAKITEKPWQTALWGIITGLISDASVLVFVFVGLIENGIISVRKALPFFLWNNAGAAPIMLILVIDIKVAVLFVFGMAGLLYYFQKPNRHWYGTGAVLGLAMLFFGLQILQQAVQPVHGSHVLHNLIRQTTGSYGLAFFIGTALTVIAQSSTAVSLIAIALTKVDILEINDTMMVIYGTNVGSSLITWLLSSGLKGTGKQLAMYQVIFNFVGAAILIPMFYLEVHFHVPLVKWVVAKLATSVEEQMALVYVIFQVLPAIIMFAFMDQFHAFLSKTWPVSEEEDLSKLKYIHDHAVSEPQTAMDHAEKEQLSLTKFLPEYIECGKTEIESGQVSQQLQMLRKAFLSISEEIKSFTNELVNLDLDHQTAERLLNIINRQEVIVSLEENIYQMVSSIQQTAKSDELRGLIQNLLEAMQVILFTAIDAMQTFAKEDLDILMTITQERGELMRNIRGTYLTKNDALDYQGKSALLELTNRFERIVWLTERLGNLLSSGSQFRFAAVSATA